ncbi:MAG: response regulator [Chloroflexia bacterium]
MTQHFVLVVDDDLDISTIVAEVLELEGYEVRTASNGLEAMEAIHAEQTQLILLDIRMPIMDGWQFASNLRDKYNRRIPVVVMTAAPDAKQRAFEVGAEGYIAKPFDIDQLIELVRRYVP